MSGNKKTLPDLPDFPEWRTLLDGGILQHAEIAQRFAAHCKFVQEFHPLRCPRHLLFTV